MSFYNRILCSLFGSKLGFSRILDSLFGGVHAFGCNSAESEPIWIKSGALWVHCRGLALADFGRDPSRTYSWRARRNVFPELEHFSVKFGHPNCIGLFETSCEKKTRTKGAKIPTPRRNRYIMKLVDTLTN